MIPEFLGLVRDNQSPKMIVVEIGVGIGDTTKEWLPIVNENGGFGILVDNFSGGPGFEELQKKMKQTITDIIKLYPKTILLEGISWEMAAKVPDKSVDVVYIDADHKYSSISKDIVYWAQKIKPGGILAGHDCEFLNYYDPKEIEADYVNRRHHGVIKAVSELLNDVKLIKYWGRGSSTWYTKNHNVNLHKIYPDYI